MAIRVNCECGLRKDVPDDWMGRHVKCKCGRSLIVGQRHGASAPPPVMTVEGSLTPPIPEPTPQSPPSPPDQPPAHRTPTSPDAPPAQSAPPPPDAPPAASDRKRSSTVYRPARRSRSNRLEKVIIGSCLAALAMIGVAATVYVMELRSGSDRQVTVSPDPGNPDGRPDSVAGKRNSSAGQSERKTIRRESGGPSSGTKRGTAAVVELEADDGVLLTGVFGDEYLRLTLDEDQQKKVDELAQQFKSKDIELKEGKLSLEVWLFDGQELGNQLLDVLTDPQRQQMLTLIQRDEMTRVMLDEYAVRLRPELTVPHVDWDVEADKSAVHVIKESKFDALADGRWYYSKVARGAVAVTSGSGDEDADTVGVWDLVSDRQIGSCDLTGANVEPSSLLSRDGKHLVLNRQADGGANLIEVWSVESGELLSSKELPREDENDPNSAFALSDCVANRVVCAASQGYWVWNFEADKDAHIGFSEWVPKGVPAVAVSASGSYLAAAHVHAEIADPKEYHFVEVSLYALDTGQVLGNQVVATDYRKLNVNTIAFSDNGLELALIWDVGPTDPKRSLVRLDARKGKVVKIVEGLPKPSDGYATAHNLTVRDLIGLPDNVGWVVNLQSIVDEETGAIIDLELPKSLLPADSNGSDREAIVEAIPAGDGRLLLVIAQRSGDSTEPAKIRTEFLELPRLGPFM